jgi:hypothetical protein
MWRWSQRAALEFTTAAHEKMKVYYDRHTKDTTYRSGDMVYVRVHPQKKGFSTKLMAIWHGPYRLGERQPGGVTFQLLDATTNQLKNVQHVNRLKKYHGNNRQPEEVPGRSVADAADKVAPEAESGGDAADDGAGPLQDDPHFEIEAVDPAVPGETGLEDDVVGVPEGDSPTVDILTAVLATSETPTSGGDAPAEGDEATQEGEEADSPGEADDGGDHDDQGDQDGAGASGDQTAQDSAGDEDDEADPIDEGDADDGQDAPESEKEEEEGAEKLYTVEEVLAHRMRKGKLEYYVRWLGHEDRTWEAEVQFCDPTLVARYWKERDVAARHRGLRPWTASVSSVGWNLAQLSTQDGPPRSLRTVCGAILRGLLVSTVLWCAGTAATRTTTELQMGPAFDCTVVARTHTYAFQREDQCSLKERQAADITHYEAAVYQYHPQVRQVPMYLCFARKVVLKCVENFFGSKEETAQEYVLTVTPAECERARRTKMTRFGPLKSTAFRKLRTDNKRAYDCAWVKTKTVRFTQFWVETKMGTVTGDNPVIQQTVTRSTCRFKVQEKFGTCVVLEDKQSALVWTSPRKNTVNYQKLGIYPVTQVGEMVLVGDLGIGGSILTTDGRTLLLDNGYMLEHNGTDPHNLTGIWAQANAYVGGTKASVQREMMEAHLGRVVLAQKYFNIGLSQRVCTLQQQMSALQGFVLSAFPDLGGLFLFPKQGYRFVKQGAALLAKRCKEISNYTVRWSRKVKGKCYQDLPIRTSESTLRFLNPMTMKLANESVPRSCTDTKAGRYFVFNKGGDTYQVKVKRGKATFVKHEPSPLEGRHKLPMLALYNTKLTHQLPLERDRTMAMEAIDDMADTINALNADYMVAGVDNIADFVTNGVKNGVDQVEGWARNIEKRAEGWFESKIIHVVLSVLHWIITGILVLVVYRRRRRTKGSPEGQGTQIICTSPDRVRCVSAQTGDNV